MSTGTFQRRQLGPRQGLLNLQSFSSQPLFLSAFLVGVSPFSHHRPHFPPPVSYRHPPFFSSLSPFLATVRISRHRLSHFLPRLSSRYLVLITYVFHPGEEATTVNGFAMDFLAPLGFHVHRKSAAVYTVKRQQVTLKRVWESLPGPFNNSTWARCCAPGRQPTTS